MLIENRVLAGSLFPKMSLLVDKFKPSGFEGLTLHEEVNHKLKQLVNICFKAVLRTNFINCFVDKCKRGPSTSSDIWAQRIRKNDSY